MGTYEIQNVRFFAPAFKAIHTLAVEPEFHKLALSRSDGCIEVWNIKHAPHIERIFSYEKDSSTVESIAWCNGRLFSCGLPNHIIEYDLLNLKIKVYGTKTIYRITATSGPCWCIGISQQKTKLAAGTEDGFINIFSVCENNIVLDKLLDKQEGRILCLVWDYSGNFLATGSEDTVRIWNVSSGHAIHKLMIARIQKKTPTIVWCLAVTEDFTIISGDSRGKLTFWDGNLGLHLDSHQTHKADILSVCLNNTHSKVYSSGVDPLIVSLEKVVIRSSGMEENVKWVKSVQRVIHEGDVRCMAIYQDKLFSGGLDGYLASSSYPPKVLIKYSPTVTQNHKLSLAREVKLLLCTYDTWLEIWSLQEDKSAVHVLKVISYKHALIHCSGISPNGRWIAFATNRTLRVGLLTPAGDALSMTKASGVPPNLDSATCLRFSNDSTFLVVASRNGRIWVLNLGESGCCLDVQYQWEGGKDCAHLIAISCSNRDIVVADRSGNIQVWRKGQHWCHLPKYDSIPTAIAINSIDEIVIAYADHKIMEFSLREKSYTSFSKSLEGKHPKQWLGRQFPVEGMLFDPSNDNIIIFYDDTTICILDKNKKLPHINRKIPRLDPIVKGLDSSSDSMESNSGQYSFSSRSQIYAFNVLKMFKHLVFLDVLSEKELIAVEVNLDAVMKGAKPVFKKKAFGVM